MIYAIRCVNTSFVKFGRANNVGRRLKELDTCCPHELEIAAVVSWPDGSETAIHRHLHQQRLKGEWFQDNDTVQRIRKKGKYDMLASHVRAREVREPFDMSAWRTERAARMRG